VKLWSFSTQVAKFDATYFIGHSEGHCHKGKGSSALVQGQVASSDEHFSKLVTGTALNNFRLWNIGAPLALF